MTGNQKSQPRGSKELNTAARGSLITLVGAAASAGLGFAFNIMLARTLGTSGAGVVLQTVAVFTIVMSLARLGLDTTAVWLLPRLVSTDKSRLRQASTGILVPAFLAPAVVVGAWLLLQGFLDGNGALSPEVSDALTGVMFFLPAASVMTVALAGTRAFGGVVPFNAIGNVLVPALRPALLAATTAAGLGAGAAALGWAIPWLVGMVLALAVFLRQLNRATRSIGGSLRPDAEMRGTIARFAAPRVLASGLDQTIIWLDVVLVGVLIGTSAAGVYGSVSRFVSAGALVSVALRIVVAPRFSALLAERKMREVEDLYTTTARWILLMGAPIYLTLAIFAPTVLGWLGPGFGSGTTSMVLLCSGSLLVLAAGNVQALLLMSGRSAASAMNKVAVVAVNVVGNIVLVPRFGINGAASVWVASMVLDTGLAVWQVRRGTGLSLAPGAVGFVLLVVTVTVAVPSFAVVAVLGQGNLSLLVAIALSGVVLVCYCFLDRRRLRLDELSLLRRAR